MTSTIMYLFLQWLLMGINVSKPEASASNNILFVETWDHDLEQQQRGKMRSSTTKRTMRGGMSNYEGIAEISCFYRQ